MKIQRMVIDDYPYVKDLWRECELSEEPEDQKDEVEALLQSSQASGFIAQSNGNIFGAVLCGSDGRYGYIHHLAVSKAHRRKGIGRSLVEECIRYLQRRHVVIMVREKNENGTEFWNHLQFQNADWIKVQFIKTEH
jgi:ribosomal protein S18 acetylase RimI-like enzyme